MRPLPAAVLAFALAGACGAWAAGPHQHGSARLDVAVEAGKVMIDLESPLDSLLGFERAPRNDAERARVAAAIAALEAAETLLRIDAAAQCSLAGVTLSSAALGLGAPAAPPAAKPAAAGHADLDASYTFDCKGPLPGFVEVGLFEAFPRLQRIDVQTATPKGQTGAVLRRPARRIGLSR